ncbi:dTDP-4-dehydrorhamnose reductase [Vibrio sp. JC009]|uniref:dTDP-4-dehydrorhamnose reductase n=1 Tax=Vibrio sp. JC009 TaxID=2912314 RepID=UPI003183CDF3
MKLLIVGANGQLGRCLQDRVQSKKYECLATDVDQLDITDTSSVMSLVTESMPDIIINAAAYTAVDKAETESELAYAVNSDGPKNLAEAAKSRDIPLIHISTDYVFDGKSTSPYKCDALTNPQGVYGESKLAGERSVIDTTSQHIIIRTAWVFSEYGNNFVKTMIRLATERDEVGVVADQYGCPTYAGDLADVVLKAVDEYFASSNFSKYGVYHFCGSEATSWHGFARAIFSQAESLSVINKQPKLKAIKTEDYPTPARRPEYSVLDCSAIDSCWLVNRDWQRSLFKVLKQY